MNKRDTLTQHQYNIIRALAEHDMRQSRVADAMHYSDGTITHHVKRIEKLTGLNPTKFYDLVKLLGLAEHPEHIAYPERKTVYHEALETYGEEKQIKKAVQELTELLLAISYYPEEKCGLDALVDEIADVTIMCEQLRMIYGISDEEVCDRMDYKIQRLVERIQKEK